MRAALIQNACLIDGQWIAGPETAEVRSPADDSLLGTVPVFGEEHTYRAIAAAERALPSWSRRTAAARSEILMRLHGLMLAHRDELAELLTLEQGKPLAEARGEIGYAASFLAWFAEEAKRTYGDITPSTDPGSRLFTIKQPIGVCAAITPWNFPAAMITRKLGPALAAGCTMVLKPAEQTPLTALAIGYLAMEAGVPDGVFNIVTGRAREIGKALVESPVVRKLSFTGSTEVGALLYAQSAPTIKRLSLELGGNAPFIVFDDADIEQAVKGAIQSKFRNAGQTCVCANRFFVQASVYDHFVTAFAEAAQALVVADGRDPGSQIGPLIDDDALAKVERLIGDAVRKGARSLTGGQISRLGGRFFEPTVLADVTSEMDVLREEIFGPVAPVVRFTSEEEVIALANDSPFGLAAYFYARDIGRIWRVAEAIEAGMVGVNTGLISTEVAPFGGIKASGLGREGSRHGIEDYLELKMLCMAV